MITSIIHGYLLSKHVEKPTDYRLNQGQISFFHQFKRHTLNFRCSVAVWWEGGGGCKLSPLQ